MFDVRAESATGLDLRWESEGLGSRPLDSVRIARESAAIVLRGDWLWKVLRPGRVPAADLFGPPADHTLAADLAESDLEGT